MSQNQSDSTVAGYLIFFVILIIIVLLLRLIFNPIVGDAIMVALGLFLSVTTEETKKIIEKLNGYFFKLAKIDKPKLSLKSVPLYGDLIAIVFVLCLVLATLVNSIVAKLDEFVENGYLLSGENADGIVLFKFYFADLIGDPALIIVFGIFGFYKGFRSFNLKLWKTFFSCLTGFICIALVYVIIHGRWIGADQLNHVVESFGGKIPGDSYSLIVIIAILSILVITFIIALYTYLCAYFGKLYLKLYIRIIK